MFTYETANVKGEIERKFSKSSLKSAKFWRFSGLEKVSIFTAKGTSRQEYKEPYLYIFKMTDKTGSSNRLSSRVHSHSHRLIQPNKAEVCIITVILAR